MEATHQMQLLKKFSDATNAAKTQALDTTERTAAADAAQVMVDEAHALATKLSLIRTKNASRVSEAHGVDWVAVIAALPADFVYNKTSRTMQSKSRKAVAMLKDAAALAYGAINSTIGDSERGPRDHDPVSLKDAAECVQAFIDGQNSEMLIDPASKTPSGTYRRALSHLREWLVRGRRIVDSAEQAIEFFNRAEQFAKEVLENAQPRGDLKLAPPPERLAPLPDAPPAIESHSRADFDPRGYDANPVVDETVVEKVGAGDGLRVRRIPTRKGR
jgi:uncharacterized protein YbjT (DUF2867 family)